MYKNAASNSIKDQLKMAQTKRGIIRFIVPVRFNDKMYTTGLTKFRLVSPVCLLTLLSILSFLNARSQAFTGVVKSTENEIIPFATLYVVKNGITEYGWVCDGNGMFSIDAGKIRGTDSLYVSSLGYFKIAVAVGNMDFTKSFEVELKPKTFYLNSVRIESEKAYRKDWLGTHKNHTNWGNWCGGHGTHSYWLAVFIPNAERIEGVLNCVKIKFSELPDSGIGQIIRIHVYAVSNKKLQPGAELLPVSVYPSDEDMKRSWVKIDLSKYGVKFPNEGFFVGVEFLPQKVSAESKDLSIDILKGENVMLTPTSLKDSRPSACLQIGRNNNAYSNTWFKRNVQAKWHRRKKEKHVDADWASEIIIGAEILFYEK